MDPKKTIIGFFLLIVTFSAVLTYDYLVDDSTTINTALSTDFSNFLNISLLIFYFIYVAARFIHVFIHEWGHRLSLFGFGEIKYNWIKIFVPFWPKGPLGEHSSSTNSKLGAFLMKIWEPIVSIAGIATNLFTAAIIFLFLKNMDLTNYLHIFIFLIGLECLLAGILNMISVSETADFTKFFATFRINIFIKTIIALSISIALFIFFKEYYIDNLLNLLNLIGQNNFHLSFVLPT